MRVSLCVSLAGLLLGLGCTASNNVAIGDDLAGGSGNNDGAASDGSSLADGSALDGGTLPDLVAASTSCPPPPACNAAPPAPGAAAGWGGFPPLGNANHRGRDLFLKASDTQWVLARFAYGATVLEAGVSGKEVDVYLLRDCGATWEKLDTTTTTDGSQSTTAEGITDAAGRVFYAIPQGKKLGPGRHRLHLVLKADLSTTDLFIEVVPDGTEIFVSDVDGTLTTSENAQFTSLFTGSDPDANPDAAAALSKLAEKGYRPMYLTARPEWLVQKTRDWLAAKGFPPGIIHTTLGGTGALGNSAATFKSDELAAIKNKGIVLSYLIGNTDTDATAYDDAGVLPLDHRIFFQYTDATYNGRRIEAYSELLSEFGALPLVCQ